jgi:hypothetical protein
MDVSDFTSGDINNFLARVQLSAFKENKNPKVVLIRAFLGGGTGNHVVPLTRAFTAVALRYREKGITVTVQKFYNDMVKYRYHWTCTELFNRLLAADIHLVPTHLHQGLLGQGGLGTWNMINILANLQRLKHHLGFPCGKYVDDPVGSQDKANIYKPLMELGLCAPTSDEIDITTEDVSSKDLEIITR